MADEMVTPVTDGAAPAPENNADSPAGAEPVVQPTQAELDAQKDFQPAAWQDSLPEAWRGEIGELKSMDEALEAFKRGVGYRPATSIDELVTKAPDGVEIDEGFNKAFRELGVKIGLTAEQAQALVNFESEQMAGAQKKAVDEATAELRQRWGANFEQNSKRAGEMLIRLDQKMGNRLSAALGEGGLANSPTLIEAFAVLGDLISEDSLAGGASGSAGQQTETAEQMFKSLFGGNN